MTTATKRKMPWHGYKCPKCGGTEQIDVAAIVWVRLTTDGSDADESNDGSHEWDDESAAHCHRCDHPGKVAEFRFGKPMTIAPISEENAYVELANNRSHAADD